MTRPETAGSPGIRASTCGLAWVLLTTLPGWVSGCRESPTGASPEARPATNVATTVSGGGASAAEDTDLRKVVGRWLRPDGGYILEIRSLDGATGKLDAAYLNPQPIHVAKAEAKREGGKVTVFVELQDANYPGCTYRLTYFQPTDQLFGTYYQAAMDQSFEVEFVREK